VRASGGAGINTSVPRAPLDVQAGTTGLGVSPDPGTVLLAEKQRATPSSPSSEPRGRNEA
jgi:hypothetical protein